jgi:hypothetical protein
VKGSARRPSGSAASLSLATHGFRLRLQPLWSVCERVQPDLVGRGERRARELQRILAVAGRAAPKQRMA